MSTPHQQMAASALAVGDRVITGTSVRIVTSVRIEGPAGGTVSVAYNDALLRTHYRPGDLFTVVRPSIR